MAEKPLSVSLCSDSDTPHFLWPCLRKVSADNLPGGRKETDASRRDMRLFNISRAADFNTDGFSPTAGVSFAEIETEQRGPVQYLLVEDRVGLRCLVFQELFADHICYDHFWVSAQTQTRCLFQTPEWDLPLFQSM